jgi:hypothetical protein
MIVMQNVCNIDIVSTDIKPRLVVDTSNEQYSKYFDRKSLYKGQTENMNHMNNVWRNKAIATIQLHHQRY